MNRLEGKVALISGRAHGEGWAVALRFAAEGALVVCGDLSHDSLGTAQDSARDAVKNVVTRRRAQSPEAGCPLKMAR